MAIIAGMWSKEVDKPNVRERQLGRYPCHACVTAIFETSAIRIETAKYFENEAAISGIIQSQPIVMAFEGYVGHIEQQELNDPATGKCPQWLTTIEKLYQSSGVTGLDKIHGDWSSAIIDLRTQKIYLIRSHMGVRPMFFRRVGDGFQWATEIGLLQPRPNELDEEWLALFAVSPLLPRFPMDEATTPYKGISRVPSGTAVVYDLDTGTLSQTSLDASNVKPQLCVDIEDTVRLFRRTFLESVHSSTMGITNCAVHISGGLDSASVACSVKSLETAPQLTSVTWYVSPTEDAEEKCCVECLLQHLQSDHVALYYSDAWMMKDFQQVTKLYDEPTMESASHWQGVLTSEALRSANSAVLLGGHGGDHLTAGSPLHLNSELRALHIWAFLKNVLGDFARTQSLRSSLVFAFLLAFRPQFTFEYLLGAHKKIPEWIRADAVRRFCLDERLHESWKLVGVGVRNWSQRLDVQQIFTLAE